MSHLIKRSSTSLRIGILLGIVTLGFASYAYADTPNVASPSNELLGVVSLAPLNDKDVNYGSYVHSGKDFGNIRGGYIVDQADGNGKLAKLGDNKYSLVMKTVLENRSQNVLQSALSVHSFPAEGIEVTDMTARPLGQLSSKFPGKIYAPGWGTSSTNMAEVVAAGGYTQGGPVPEFYYYVADIAAASDFRGERKDGNVQLDGYIPLSPGQRLEYEITVKFSINSSADSANLSCNGFQSIPEYNYYSKAGRKGLNIQSYYAAVESQNYWNGSTSVASRTCADVSKLVPAAVSSQAVETTVTPQTVPTASTAPAPTVPTVPSTVPETLPLRVESSGPVLHAPSIPSIPTNQDSLPSQPMVQDVGSGKQTDQSGINETADATLHANPANDTAGVQTELVDDSSNTVLSKDNVAGNDEAASQGGSKVLAGNANDSDFSPDPKDLKWLAIAALFMASAGLTSYGIKQNIRNNILPPTNGLIDIDEFDEPKRPYMSTVNSDIEYIDVYSHYKAGEFSRAMARSKSGVEERESFAKKILDTLLHRKSKAREYVKR